MNPVHVFMLKNLAKSAGVSVLEEKELDPVADRAAIDELMSQASVAGKKIRIVKLGNKEQSVTLFGMVNPGTPTLADKLI